jgi:site-specific DNA-methyltransferase (adenine-specific)/modification methylase
METNKIYQGDCLELMKQIEDKSIDLILCDLPYGVLNKTNKSVGWDVVIPFDKLWEQYKRIIKEDGAIILTAQGLFSAKLMLSNESMWRYNLVWKKGNRTTGFLNCNRQPLRNHEDILVFSKKQTKYNPQMEIEDKNHKRGFGIPTNNVYGKYKIQETILTNEKYPLSILDFSKGHKGFFHPTEKPVALFEYLIKTYTDEGDLVLDNCIGSGTTAVACVNTKRNFIGIELSEEYCKIANERLIKLNNGNEGIPPKPKVLGILPNFI